MQHRATLSEKAFTQKHACDLAIFVAEPGEGEYLAGTSAAGRLNVVKLLLEARVNPNDHAQITKNVVLVAL